MSTARRTLVGAAAIIALGGCSSIPEGGDPASDDAIVALARSGRAPLGRLAVAPIATWTLAPDEVAKEWQLEQVPSLGAAGVRRQLARALAASAAWDRVREAEDDAFEDAWRNRDDLVASLSIANLRTSFDGHNALWVPNIVNFLANTPAAWWIATEEYSLSLEATLVLASAHSGAPIARRTIPIAVSGTFDDFDRGWQFFGPIHASLEAENWRTIAARLFPAAERRLAVAAAVEADAAAREALSSAASRKVRHKTLVLAVGVTSYLDARAFPPLAFAAGDAQLVARTFRELGEPPRHIQTLTDGRATLAAVTAAIDEHLGRACDGDSVVLSFAGYGFLAPGATPALALHDGPLLLGELCERLARLGGDKLLIVDAGFGGRGRSIAAREPGASIEPVLASGLTLVLAGAVGDSVLAPEHLASGLLTHHIVRAIGRLRDEEQRGRLGLDEVFPAVQAAVMADAELLGTRQSARLLGAPEFSLSLGARP